MSGGPGADAWRVVRPGRLREAVGFLRDVKPLLHQPTIAARIEKYSPRLFRSAIPRWWNCCLSRGQIQPFRAGCNFLRWAVRASGMLGVPIRSCKEYSIF